MPYLKKIRIEDIWIEGKNLIWDTINPDVNILVGINGSGKSTLLNILWEALTKKNMSRKKYSFSSIFIEDEDGNTVFRKNKGVNNPIDNFDLDYEFISTFDMPGNLKSLSISLLTQELLDIIYTTGKEHNTFFDYRLKATNFPEKAKEINDKIQNFYQLINKHFELTNKKIGINTSTNKIEFYRNTKEADPIQIEDLSSGEKQFLLILFKVFLMEDRKTLLIMDEPEISLDIDWQFELINTIRKINPNCQIIIATHSPSIFGDGWGNKVTYMENILPL